MSSRRRTRKTQSRSRKPISSIAPTTYFRKKRTHQIETYVVLTARLILPNVGPLVSRKGVLCHQIRNLHHKFDIEPDLQSCMKNDTIRFTGIFGFLIFLIEMLEMCGGFGG